MSRNKNFFLKLFVFKKSEVRGSDFAFYLLVRGVAWIIILSFLAIIWFLLKKSLPIFQQFGANFIFSREWDPISEVYGALPFIYGTLVSSMIALLLALPISIGAAVFLTELAPKWLKYPVGFLIEMLAAIPSVVYGLWGIFVLAPFVRDYFQSYLSKNFGTLPFFQGPPFGIGMLSAGVILAIMILPTITTIIREVFLAIPQLTREAALTLGATRWETISLAVIQTGMPGIISAVILGLGRAMGETMAVTMLIGNRPTISLSLFSPAATMSSVIANEYPEASSDLHLSALTAIGLVLFGVSLLVNLLARVIVYRFKKRASQ